MFRFTELKVKDWCQHRERVEEFVSGTNGVIGSNGRGKSNLVTALFTAVTGRVLVDTIQENINFEADKTVIEAKFVQNGIPGSIKRTFNAPRIDGSHHNRKDATSTAELVWGTDVKVKGASKVTAELERITGMSPRTIEDHIFVSQDKLSELLFQRKSDRLKSFLSLIPGVERVEVLRIALQNELNKYVEVQLAMSSAEARTQVDTVRSEVTELDAEVHRLQAELATVDLSKITQVIAKYKETVQAERRLADVQRDVDGLQALADSTLVKQAEADQQLSATLTEVETHRSMAVEAQGELKSLEQNRTIFNTRRTTEAALSTLMNEIETKQAPSDVGAPWVDLPVWEAQRDKHRQALAESRKVLQLLAKGDNCPTCGKPFDNAVSEREKHTALVADLAPREQLAVDTVARLVRARDAYTTAKSQYTNWLQVAEAKLGQLTTTLEGLPVVQEPTAERIQTLTRLVEGYNEAVRQSKAAEHESKKWSDVMSNTSQKLRVLEDTKINLEEVIAQRPDAATLAAADAQQRQYETLNNSAFNVSGRLTAKREELTRAEANLLRIEVAEARAKSVTDYRGLITEVRDVLHRDRLPMEVLITYIQSLDQLINRYLDLFGNPFAITLDKEMDMACYFSNGYVCGTQRLSGGQKCVLSVAVRFAINELFAKDLGLLVLDEPTSAMDTANVAYTGELMEKIHAVGKGVGVQTIIITHAQELIPCFEKVIKV